MKIPIVFIEFYDHKGYHGWQDENQLSDMKPGVCYACGFLTCKDDLGYRISCIHDGEGLAGTTMYILKSTVRTIKRIKL